MVNKTDDVSIWEDDRFNRKSDADFLQRFLINRVEEKTAAGRPASYVLNIDAQWGQGKSFFLDRFGKMLSNEHYLVAHVNAWQDDHADDPLLSVMDAIDKAVAPVVAKEKKARGRWEVAKRTGGAVAVAAAKGATYQLAKKAFGTGADEIAELLGGAAGLANKTSEEVAKAVSDIVGEQGKALLASFHASKRTITDFKTSLAEFLNEAAASSQPLPLFVFVDELDRCRPPFAIAMLERIKHLFDIDQVVFVIATDTSQLSHSISAIYGVHFDGAGYLQRFFNRTYQFAKTSQNDFVAELIRQNSIDETKISVPPNMDFPTYLSGAFDFFALSPRSAEQTYDALRTFVTAWQFKCEIEVIVLFPIIVAHHARLDVALDDRFTLAINEMAQNRGGARSSWNVLLRQESYSGPAQGEGVNALAGALVRAAARALPTIYEQEVNTVAGRWIRDRLGNEFMREHGNTHSTAGGPFSVILEYVEMVKTAGRLSSKLSDN